MKKRVITGMMTASVIVSLAGCGAGRKETVESTAPATMTETVAASQVETAEVTETEDDGAGRPCIKNQSLSGSIGKYLSESYFAGRIRIER